MSYLLPSTSMHVMAVRKCTKEFSNATNIYVYKKATEELENLKVYEQDKTYHHNRISHHLEASRRQEGNMVPAIEHTF